MDIDNQDPHKDIRYMQEDAIKNPPYVEVIDTASNSSSIIDKIPQPLKSIIKAGKFGVGKTTGIIKKIIPGGIEDELEEEMENEFGYGEIKSKKETTHDLETLIKDGRPKCAIRGAINYLSIDYDENMHELVFEAIWTRGCYKDIIDHLLDKIPDDYRNHSLAGQVCLKKSPFSGNPDGKKREAIEHYKQAFALNPKDVYSCNQIGMIFLCLDDNKNAKEFLFKAKKLEPLNPLVWMSIGEYYSQVSNYAESMYCYKHAFKLFKNSSEENNALNDALAPSHHKLVDLLIKYDYMPGSFEEAKYWCAKQAMDNHEKMGNSLCNTFDAEFEDFRPGEKFENYKKRLEESDDFDF